MHHLTPCVPATRGELAVQYCVSGVGLMVRHGAWCSEERLSLVIPDGMGTSPQHLLSFVEVAEDTAPAFLRPTPAAAVRGAT